MADIIENLGKEPAFAESREDRREYAHVRGGSMGGILFDRIPEMPTAELIQRIAKQEPPYLVEIMASELTARMAILDEVIVAHRNQVQA